MGAAYATLADVRRRMAGDAVITSGVWDEEIVAAIGQVSDQLDEEIRNLRGQAPGWSILAASDYAVQRVSISPASATGGTFTLTSGASTTTAIAYNASASTVQTALDAVLGSGNSVVTGAPGGPWTVTYAGTLTGDQPTLEPASSLTAATGSPAAVVEMLVPGASATVTRRYTGRGSALLLIDDCVSVSAVRLTDSAGNLVQTLALGTDYVLHPLNGPTVTGLLLLSGGWPTTPGGIAVDMRPGLLAAVPADLTRACTQEVMRNIRAAQAGENDQFGITAYGTVMTSKALLQSTWRVIHNYRHGAGFLRAAG